MGLLFNFIIWGGLHGLYQIIGYVTKNARTKIINILRIKTEVFSYRLFRVLTTFILIDFAWLFFRASSFSSALLLIKNSFYFNPWIFTDGSIYKLGLDAKEFTVAILSIGIIFIRSYYREEKMLGHFCPIKT